MNEIISKRTPNTKVYKKEHGILEAKVYGTRIHYLKDGKYEEIKNNLIDRVDRLVNEDNSYVTTINKDTASIRYEQEKNYLEIIPTIEKSLKCCIDKNTSKYSKVTFSNAFQNVDLSYEIFLNKVKENIVINKKTKKSSFEYTIDTNLDLKLEKNELIALKGKKAIFKFLVPFAVDNNNVYGKVDYKLKDNNLAVIIDSEWLNDKSRKYPIAIDPTIINTENDVDDTYIYNGDTNETRYNRDYIISGVQKVNGNDRTNRSLLRFYLPTLGTGEEVVEAELMLCSCPVTSVERELTPEEIAQNAFKQIEIHKLTSDWTLQGANWNNMNSNYSNTIEAIGLVRRSYYTYNYQTQEYEFIPQYGKSSILITDLVKRWYKDEPNYGIMIKQSNETYINDLFPLFFSSNYSVEDVIPLLVIRYKNQSGLESYYDYSSQSFTDGKSFVNNYNGNLVSSFNLASTLGVFPVNLGITYNTNDVVLNNNTVYGKGYKLTLDETIREVTIDNNSLLEYCDGDGTIHYFYNENDVYHDEDGLELEAVKSSSVVTITDKTGNKTRFTKNGDIYYLDKITNLDNREVTITRNNGNQITKITDSNNEEINISYESSIITISSPKETTYLNISNNNLSSISTKNGNTFFTYNSDNIVTSITDVNGMKVSYEYYSNSPYKIKKVKEYGDNNLLGKSFEIDYGLKTSTITDNKGRITTNIYNHRGNLLSRNNMTSTSVLKDTYSVGKQYGDFNCENKVISSTVPIKYVKNLFGPTNYSNMNNVLEFSINMSLVNEYVPFDGASAVKLVSSTDNQFICYNEQITASPKKTVSMYIKTTGSVKVGFYEYESSMILYEKDISSSNSFEKVIYTSDTYDFYIKITNITACTTYIGDIQIEEGEVCSDVNIVYNSDFSDGMNGWTLSPVDSQTGLPDNNVFDVVTIDNYGNKALKVNMNLASPANITKDIDILGTTDDLFYLSFWYKNEGLETNETPDFGATIRNSATVYFEPQVGEIEHCIPEIALNSNKETWQYFSMPFAPSKDYKKIRISLLEIDCGTLYITNFALYKSLKTAEYSYDENGNVIGKRENYDDKVFGYDNNNELINGANARGRNFKLEYDNTYVERVLRSTSSTGLSNKMSYDSYGNPTKIKVSHDYNDSIVTDYYKIRLKGTNYYLNISNGELLFREDYCSNTIYKVTISNDELKICDGVFENRFLNLENNMLVLSNNELLFKYELNDNGSYHIYLYEEEIVPGGSIVHYKYLKMDNNHVILVDNPNDLSNNYLYEFYFEKVSGLFIETTAEYTNDGRFLTSVTDSLYAKTEYLRNNTSGLLTKIIDAKGNETQYTYNLKNQITKIKQGNKEVNYSYNSNNNLLEQISQNNKIFDFTYNNFLNVSLIKINNRSLISNTYDNNNGNLLSSTYGNGSVITYTYDDFDRIKTVSKSNNNVTEYFYNSNGNLSKIKENTIESIFDYDLSKRLRFYKKNDFSINYSYDIDDNLIKKNYKYQSNNSELSNAFDKDGLIQSSSIDNINTVYTYDELKRIINKTINTNISTNYEYKHIGKRSSSLLKSIQNGNNIYSYNYDKLYNITDVYYNNNLVNHYEYDNFNELLSDTNYINNIKYEYTYNSAGNIISKVKKDRLTDIVISTDTYSYTDSTWEDLLTSYNNETITYDAIGNPLTIGNKVLTWIDGRKLNSYTDGNLNVNYKYNSNGIRTEKIVNNISTYYILEGNHIIYENRNNLILYYFYDNNGVSGIKYNNTNYYFIKNLQGDIINIVDGNNNILVKYEYDALGNILSIRDNNGNIITNQNNVGIVNPFRYRGYYYDNETGLYYLNSRYYNPLWGRFINSDSEIPRSLNGTNLYLYCENNPISRSDKDGTLFGFILTCVVVSAVTSVLINGVNNKLSGDKFSKNADKAVIKGILFGGLLAASIVAPITTTAMVAVQAYGSAFINSTVDEVWEYGNGKEINKSNVKESVSEIIIETGFSGTFNFVTGFATPSINKGWIRPEKVTTLAFGNYTKKLIIQNTSSSLVSNSFELTTNMIYTASQNQKEFVCLYPNEYKKDFSNNYYNLMER